MDWQVFLELPTGEAAMRLEGFAQPWGAPLISICCYN